MEDIQTVNKNPSQELVDMIEDWSGSYIKTRDLPPMILQKAAEEHLDSDVVRELIIKSLTNRGLKERQIKNLMPQELRYSNRTRLAFRKSNDTQIASSPEPEPVEYVEPEPAIITGPIYESPPLERSFIVKTKLIVKTDKGNYAAEVTAVCYPDSQIVELEPIHKTAILRQN